MGRLTGDLKERTLQFGVQSMNAITELPNEPRGWIVAKQLGRSASSIGANVWEADAAHSERDFSHKISIARKEASETKYWIELATRAQLLRRETCRSLGHEAEQLTRILFCLTQDTGTLGTPEVAASTQLHGRGPIWK